MELECKLSTPGPEQARPLWEHWLAGPPQTPGAWAGLDGRHVTDVPGIYLAVGEAVNGPGGYLGANPDALAGCLGGTFGYTAPERSSGGAPPPRASIRAAP
ncbi:hypothetical protein ACWDYJ_32365 [Streptomyces sp. NPDC003042]